MYLVEKKKPKKHYMCLTSHNYQDSLGRDLNAGDYFVWLLMLCVSMRMECMSARVPGVFSEQNVRVCRRL